MSPRRDVRNSRQSQACTSPRGSSHTERVGASARPQTRRASWSLGTRSQRNAAQSILTPTLAHRISETGVIKRLRNMHVAIGGALLVGLRNGNGGVRNEHDRVECEVADQYAMN